MSSANINVGGTWRPASTAWINVGGTWKQTQNIWQNVAGTWQHVYQNLILTISPSSVTSSAPTANIRTITVTASPNVAGGTYAWSLVSGTTFTIGSPNSATT